MDRSHENKRSGLVAAYDEDPVDWADNNIWELFDDHDDWPPIMVAADDDDDPEPLISLLQAGEDPNTNDSNGITPLMIAAYNDNSPAVNALLEAGANVDATTTTGITALMLAAYGASDPEVFSALLSGGANIDKVDDDGYTALMIAVEGREYVWEYEVVELLVDAGADVNATNHFEETALMLAASIQPDYVELLLKAGAKPNVTKRNLRTPLIYAVIMGDVYAVRDLLRYGAKADVADKYDESPLIIAINMYAANYEQNYLLCINALLEGGANPNFTTDITPLQTAVTNNDVRSVRYLVRAGAIDSGLLLTEVIMENNVDMVRALLQTSVANTRLDVVARVSKTEDMYSMMRGEAADMPPLDYYLYVAALYGADAVVPVLLHAGATINSILSPVTAAEEAGHAAVVRQLKQRRPRRMTRRTYKLERDEV